MTNLLLRDLSDHIASYLKVSAKKNKRSVNGEILSILEQVAAVNPTRIDTINRVQTLRKGFRSDKVPAGKLVRELRDGASGRKSS